MRAALWADDIKKPNSGYIRNKVTDANALTQLRILTRTLGAALPTRQCTFDLVGDLHQPLPRPPWLRPFWLAQ
jgi:hypothetical protein